MPRRSNRLLMLAALAAPQGSDGAWLRARDAPPAVHLAAVNQSHETEAKTASVAKAASAAAANATHNASMPFSARAEPAIGKVWALYYSSYSDAQATSVEATEEYIAVAKNTEAVWAGSTMLPEPACGLQLRTQTNYPSANRKANLRLAELAICGLLFGNKAPSCGASSNQVCQLKIFAPFPSSDEIQEPYLAASMALAAYSKICALRQSSAYNAYKCQIHRSESAISAGLKLEGGSIKLSGMTSPGLLDLKLNDAYLLKMKYVYFAAESKTAFGQTDFSSDRHDVLKWQHEPPKVYFCGDLQCLVSSFITS